MWCDKDPLLHSAVVSLLNPSWAHQCESESESGSVVSDSLWPHGLYSPWNSPGQNTGVGNLSVLQGIFPTQGSNLGLLHCRQILYQLSHKGSPRILEWEAYPFSSRSSGPRNRTRVSCIAGGFFTNWAKVYFLWKPVLARTQLSQFSERPLHSDICSPSYLSSSLSTATSLVMADHPPSWPSAQILLGSCLAGIPLTHGVSSL